jgi:hypothetical protein
VTTDDPAILLALVLLEQRALHVPAHIEGVEVADELVRLRRKRPPREIAAENDQVGALGLDLGQHGLERGCVPVDVRERGDPHASRRAVRRR